MTTRDWQILASSVLVAAAVLTATIARGRNDADRSIQGANVVGVTNQTDLFHTMARALNLE
jgi:hypothetical protein